MLIGNLWQLKTAVLQHWCLIYAVLLGIELLNQQIHGLNDFAKVSVILVKCSNQLNGALSATRWRYQSQV